MKVGDIVARKSYNKDIVFKITDIIVDENGKKIAILKGVAFRIIADAELSDLEILKPPDIREILMDKNVESILYRSLKKAKDRDRRNMRGLPKSAQQPANVYGVPGKVLQIDGDKEYLKICLDVYSQLGIPAVGVAIPETNQYKEVKNLLEKHKPDILVITGHDALHVKNGDLKNINNYRNSYNFLKAVKEATWLRYFGYICGCMSI